VLAWWRDSSLLVLVGVSPLVHRFISGLCLWVRIQLNSNWTLILQAPLSKGQPLPFIGWERGRPTVASMGRSHKATVKPNVLPG
jgi:hypothetical protein